MSAIGVYGDPPPAGMRKKGEVLEFKVFKFYDIDNKIIPLFKKYPIQGIKNKDFKDYATSHQWWKKINI